MRWVWEWVSPFGESGTRAASASGTIYWDDLVIRDDDTEIGAAQGMLKLIESTPTPTPTPTLELKLTEITTPTPSVTPTPTAQPTPTPTPTKEEKILPTNTATVEETPTPLPTWSPTPAILNTDQSISKELTGKGRLAMRVEPNVEVDSIKHVAAMDAEPPPDDLENAVYVYRCNDKSRGK